MRRQDKRRRRPARSAEQWAWTVKDWHRSGLSARAYAAEHDISAQSLWGWAARLRRNGPGPVEQGAGASSPSLSFLPVAVVRPKVAGPEGEAGERADECELEVEWPGGPVFRIRGVVTPELAATVVRIVAERSPC